MIHPHTFIFYLWSQADVGVRIQAFPEAEGGGGGKHAAALVHRPDGADRQGEGEAAQ